MNYVRPFFGFLYLTTCSWSVSSGKVFHWMFF